MWDLLDQSFIDKKYKKENSHVFTFCIMKKWSDDAEYLLKWQFGSELMGLKKEKTYIEPKSSF